MTVQPRRRPAGVLSPEGERTPAGRYERTRRALATLVVAAFACGTAVGLATPALAAWQGVTSLSGPVSMARLGSSFVAGTGPGTVNAAGTTYTISTVLGSVTGYVDLVSSSTVPVTLSMTVSTGNLVGVTPVSVCSVPWVPATDTCPGVVAPVPNGTYTVPVAVSGRVFLRAAAGGVVGTVTLTMNPLVGPGIRDRTTA